MMQDKIESMIYAYVLGCLDVADKRELHEYLASKEEFNFNEYGEMQNLTALIPIALPIEDVDPNVKKNVARRLNSLKNDIKVIRRRYKSLKQENDILAFGNELPSEVKTTDNDQAPVYNDIVELPETPAETVAPPPVKMPEQLPENQEYDNNNILVIKPRRTMETQRAPHDTQLRGRESGNAFTPYSTGSFPAEENRSNQDVIFPSENKDENVLIPPTDSNFESGNSGQNNTTDGLQDEEINKDFVINQLEDVVKETEKQFYKGPTKNISDVNKKSYGNIILAFITFFVIIIGIVFIYFRVSSELKNTKKEVSALEREVAQLKQTSKPDELQRFVSEKGTESFNLGGTALNQSGFGKVFVNMETGRGFIQVTQMPGLAPNHIYKLWLETSGQYRVLASFAPEDGNGSFAFNIMKIPQGIIANFLLTDEDNAVALNTPSKRVLLQGSL